MSIAQSTVSQQYSKLWGRAGEQWSPRSRLPDFSFAGYHNGEALPPHVEQVTDVKKFGAVGDGVHNDAPAFLAAIAATERGAIFIPPGRYLLRQVIWVEKPNIVLRGAGTDKTVLTFDTPLEKIRPNMAHTSNGRPTSNYSWSGGFLWARGKINKLHPSPVTQPQQRGDHVITVENAAPFAVGSRIIIAVTDDAERSLLSYIYAGDTDDTANIKRTVTTNVVAHVVKIAGQQITLDRPLPFDLRLNWSPTVAGFEPTVSEVGFEDMAFEFPNVPYQGHFTELGFNAIAFNNVADCWTRNIRITNSDSGIYLTGYFCSAYNILIDSVRADFKGDSGHHGIALGHDCLIDGFDIRTRFIHDITVDHGATGNVAKNGKGLDLSFDHHCDYPYANLFTNIDIGRGTQLWRCGGGRALGKHTGAWATFWNIRAAKPQNWPRDAFGPNLMNLVGITTNDPAQLDPQGRWFEPIAPQALTPRDLHAAQLARRLKQGDE